MPGFRIIGTFNSSDDAQMFIQNQWKNLNDSVYLIPAHQLFMICKGTDKQNDHEYNANKVKEIVDLHTEKQKKRNEDFKDNIKNRVTGKVNRPKHRTHTKVRESIIKRKFDSEVSDLAVSSPLQANAKLAGQEYAVIMTLLDITLHNAVKEPLIAILAAFNTESDAEQYAKYTAASQYPDSDISVVSMYAWCFPEHVNFENVKEVYRNEKLNDIMSTRKTQMAESKRFEAWCEETKQTPNYIDIEPENKESTGELKQPDNCIDVVIQNTEPIKTNTETEEVDIDDPPDSQTEHDPLLDGDDTFR
jgi:hypothetical protein